jgi:hypothetical protein
VAVATNKLGYFNYLLILSERFSQLWPPKFIEAGLVTGPVMRQYACKFRVFYHPVLYDLTLKAESQLESPGPQTTAA